MRVALVGYRGTGKTTVARLVAERLAIPWVDADEAVESAAGKSIKEIFAEQGELGFRDLEETVLDQLLQRPDLVLATGGGVILREANRRRLSEAHVFWLTADAETLFERIHEDPTTASRRPNLTASGGIDEIQALLRVREPLYRDVCQGEVDTVLKTPDQVASQIVSLLESGQ